VYAIRTTLTDDMTNLTLDTICENIRIRNSIKKEYPSLDIFVELKEGKMQLERAMGNILLGYEVD